MIRRQVLLPVEPERLWEALVEPDQAASWLGGRITWEVREGAPLRFFDDEGPVREGRIETVRPGRYLCFRWWPAGEGVGEGENATVVSYLLEPAEDGTRLTVQERGVAESRSTASLSLPSKEIETAIAGAFTWTRWDERMAGAWIAMSAAVQLCARA